MPDAASAARGVYRTVLDREARLEYSAAQRLPMRISITGKVRSMMPKSIHSDWLAI